MKVKDLVKDKKGRVYKVDSITYIKDLETTIKLEGSSQQFPISDFEVFISEYTPEIVMSLKDNEIFVFGSNTEGRHGAGAAKFAINKFGALYGKAEGLQGQSYAIITTDLKSIDKYPLDNIYEGILRFIKFAENNPQLKFYVTKIGSNMAGYLMKEIAEQFLRASVIIDIPSNVILPEEYECRHKVKRF